MKDKNLNVKDKRYVKKISSLSDLTEQGYVIIEKNQTVLTNRIGEVLKEKKINTSKLAKLTGLSRQNISSVINGNLNPNTDFSLKISYVLNTPIEQLFILTENAWIENVEISKENKLFVDIVNLEIIDSNEKKERFESNRFEFVNLETGELITKQIKDEYQKIYINKRKREIEQEAGTPVIFEIKAEFNKKYDVIYKKIGKVIKPYKIK